MAWSTPLTAVSNATLTAAQWNASVRDNLLETAPAKATTAGSYFVTTGANAIAERVSQSDQINTSQTTASTSYTNLATVGPSVTATTSTRAIVLFRCMANSSSGDARVSYEVTGATSVTADDSRAIIVPSTSSFGLGWFDFVVLNAGSNTFTMKYRVTAGTGTFQNRELIVLPY